MQKDLKASYKRKLQLIKYAKKLIKEKEKLARSLESLKVKYTTLQVDIISKNSEIERI